MLLGKLFLVLLCQGRSYASKIGGVHCLSFLPVPTNVQLGLQRSKASRGEEWEEVSPLPQPTTGSERSS